MHIPDGFLDAKTAVTSATLSVAALSLALRQSRRHMLPRQVPLMGVAAAFVFAAQMLNFPVAGGTSGHLMGAVLIAVLLGPSASIIVMTAVLAVQCFLFADGGVLALGANVLNMAVIAPVTGFAIFRVVHRAIKGDRGRLIAVGFASWCATVITSVVCAGELAWSGTASWAAAFTAMANVHMVIGLGEGVITVLVVAALGRTRPDLLDGTSGVPEAKGESGIGLAAYGLVVALGMALFISPFASPWPDGLETVARALGFEHIGIPAAGSSPFAEYRIPGMGSPVAATAIAGAAGTIIVFALSYLLARILTPRRAASGNAQR